MIYTTRIIDGTTFDDESSIYWTTRMKVDDACRYNAKDDVRPMTKYHWDAIVLDNTNGMKAMLVPIMRFSEKLRFTPIPHKKITLKEMLTILYDTYNVIEVSKDELVSMQDEHGDYCEYIQCALNKIERGQKAHYIDIMGNAIYYEGLKYTNNDEVVPFFGS